MAQPNTYFDGSENYYMWGAIPDCGLDTVDAATYLFFEVLMTNNGPNGAR